MMNYYPQPGFINMNMNPNTNQMNPNMNQNMMYGMNPNGMTGFGKQGMQMQNIFNANNFNNSQSTPFDQFK